MILKLLAHELINIFYFKFCLFSIDLTANYFDKFYFSLASLTKIIVEKLIGSGGFGIG